MNTSVLGLTILACVTPLPFDRLKELPVDNLTQAIATKAGVVLANGSLHIRCCCRSSETKFVVALPQDQPLEVVGRALAAFEARSATDYLMCLAPDFHYESDDPTFRERYPNGMSLDDEIVFIGRLFVGPGSNAWPRVVAVDVTHGSLGIVEETPTSAWIEVDSLIATIDLSDSTQMIAGATRSRIEVVRLGELWRIRRWLDSGAMAATADSVAAVTNLPERLAMSAHMTAGSRTLDLELSLPRAGARFELFDVQGRRVVSRDLGDLKPGTHHVSLPAAEFAAGVYWARVRLGGEMVTARVILLR